MKTRVTSDMVGCLTAESGILSSFLVARHFDDSRSDISLSIGAQVPSPYSIRLCVCFFVW